MNDIETTYLFHSCLPLSTTDDLFSLIVSMIILGPGSSVGIVTDYGLDGTESNPGRNEIFRPARPDLWPTQSPVQWVPGLSRGLKAAGACC